MPINTNPAYFMPFIGLIKQKPYPKKWFSSWGLIKELFFYRNIFTLGTLFRGLLIYCFYIISCQKKNFNPLISINFLITNDCNFACNICSYQAERNKESGSIAVRDIEKLSNALPKSKPVFFFSGGEPFMKKDFIDILTVVKKSNIKCGINTNGYLLDAGAIKKIIELKIDLIIFSLYGPEEVHDSITGVTGSYSKVCRNILLLCKDKSQATRVVLSCTITRANLDSLDKIPLIAKSLGVDLVKFEHLNFLSNREAEENKEYFVRNKFLMHTLLTDFDDHENIFAEKLISKLDNIKKSYGGFILIKPDLDSEEIKNWYTGIFRSRRTCFFIWHSIFIRPDGTVVPCQFLLNYDLGNIKNADLDDILRGDKLLSLKKLLKKQPFPECRRCCKL